MGPIDPVQQDHEARIARLEQARLSLEGMLLVMTEIERGHDNRLKEHEEALQAQERWYTRMQQLMAVMGEKLTEIGAKLDGLIGWADGTIQRSKPGETKGSEG